MTLQTEIQAFERLSSQLEENYHGKFVIIHDGDLAGHFDTFEAAADAAVKQFGRGPYLIRQVGVPQPPLSASIVARYFVTV